MRRWVLAFACVLVLGGSLSGFAQQQKRQRASPQTLETSVTANEASTPAASVDDAGRKRPAGTLARPQNGVQHPDLDKAWAEYDAAVARAAESIKAAITEQFDRATAKGDLDASEMWQQIAEKFAKAGELPADTATKAVTRIATLEYKQAQEELEKAYDGLVKNLTIEKRVTEARAIKDEATALGRGGRALEMTNPNSQSVSKEKTTPGMIGRVDAAGSDAGIVFTYLPGHVFTHERLRQVLSDRKLETSNVKVILNGTLHLGGDTDVVAWQAGGSSSGGVHRLYVDNREVGSIGDDRSKNAVYPLKLSAGSHSIKWVLTGGNFGNSHLVFMDRRNGRPLRLVYTSTMEAEAASSPARTVGNSFSMPLPKMPAIQ